MININIIKPLRRIFRRVSTLLDDLLCCRTAGMIFAVADMFYDFDAKHVERHAAYCPVSGAHPLSMMCTIQKLVWLGKNDFE